LRWQGKTALEHCFDLFCTHKYNREELYQKVWDSPVQIVAKDFGMSDVGLAKICRKLFVPLTGRGYRAKNAVGKKVATNPALPTVERQ
jgi:hypothetical protein